MKTKERFFPRKLSTVLTFQLLDQPSEINTSTALTSVRTHQRTYM